MIGRGELTEEAWGVIAPLLPARRGRRGGQWRDHRMVINGIVWKLHTGAPWRDLPERYGPWQTCADRQYRWRRVVPGTGFSPSPDALGWRERSRLGGEHR
jgi:transposase